MNSSTFVACLLKKLEPQNGRTKWNEDCNIPSTFLPTSEGWRENKTKNVSMATSWVIVEELFDCSVTKSERFLLLSLFSHSLDRAR